MPRLTTAHALAAAATTNLVVVVEATCHARLQAAQALVDLAQHRVATRNVVLGDLVDGGHPREVVAHIVAGLHCQDVLKVNERILNVWEWGQW